VNERLITALIIILGVAIFAGLYAYDREAKLRESRAQTTRLEESLSRVADHEEEQNFARLEQAAADLTDEDPKVRKQALHTFREALHRMKVRRAYPQLCSSDVQDTKP
jgi:hypothetical protein